MAIHLSDFRLLAPTEVMSTLNFNLEGYNKVKKHVLENNFTSLSPVAHRRKLIS